MTIREILYVTIRTVNRICCTLASKRNWLGTLFSVSFKVWVKMICSSKGFGLEIIYSNLTKVVLQLLKLEGHISWLGLKFLPVVLV